MTRGELDTKASHAGGMQPPIPERIGSGWPTSLAAVPGIGAAFLPKLVCPACWPAYAAVLSSMGLGFLLETAYLVPLTLLFLGLALVGLGFRARARRGYGPFAAGLLASVLVMIGKFGFESAPAMYGGIGLLVAASAWNAWPQGRSDTGSCADCTPLESATDPQNET